MNSPMPITALISTPTHPYDRKTANLAYAAVLLAITARPMWNARQTWF